MDQARKKIAVLYICTGRYELFWKNFYTSAERFFLPEHQKTYFVFTDSKEIYQEQNDNVKKIYQRSLGWPYDTLLRFQLFLTIKGDLEQHDYLFFLNANIIFLSDINEDILPGKINDGLVGVMHPYFWDKSVNIFTYERNPHSTAYIPYGAGRHYFFGAFNGGQTDAYLDLTESLAQSIQRDFRKNIIAIWHDESHLNYYLNHKNPLVLTPSYSYPEEYDLPFRPLVSILDKTRHGGHNYLRGIEENKI